MAEDESTVYAPAEDTQLVLEGLKVRAGERAVELGTGRGDIALELARRGARVEATDVNPAAVAVASARAQAEGLPVRFFVGDLFAPCKGAFDLVVFNPPYLPTGPQDRVAGALNAAFDGGADGLAVTRRFLAALPLRLKAGGRALTVVSSLSPWGAFLAAVPAGFEARVLSRARFDFEELRLVEVSRAPSRPKRKGGARSPRGPTRARSGSPRAKGKAAKGRSRLPRKGGAARPPSR
ncbi:MAG TPA: HemK2/MTQ2 family protein methyltransferase [Candidatus Thermoplasmatota archaeon]|nr:HemK2/MTQ2 family protein methyltransferase [Candidatus Thermoplasmatota archaeon]